MNAVYHLCEQIAAALNTAIPGVRCRLEITLDGNRVKPEDITVQFRPPQQQAGMRKV